MNSPCPWYVSETAGQIVILDVTGHKVATVAPQADLGVLEGNIRAIKMAPSLLVSLKLAIRSLNEAGKTEMAHHLEKYVDAATYPAFYDMVGKDVA